MNRISVEMWDADPSINLRLTDEEIKELSEQVKALGFPDTKESANFIFNMAMTAKAGTLLPKKCDELRDVQYELEQAKRRLAEYQTRCRMMSQVVDEKENTIKVLALKLGIKHDAEDRAIKKLIKSFDRQKSRKPATKKHDKMLPDKAEAHFVSENPTWML